MEGFSKELGIGEDRVSFDNCYYSVAIMLSSRLSSDFDPT